MSKRAVRSRLRSLAAALSLLTIAVSAGCVQRRMTVRSNPPGAMVYIDDYPIGATPVSTDFIYYGTRKVRLVKDGYETLTVYQPVKTPWYEWFGIDFFTENIWPGEVRDERAYEYHMIPTVQVPNEQLVSRAQQLRANSQPIPGVGIQPAAAIPPAAIIAPETLPPPAVIPPANTIPPPVGVPPMGTPPTYPPPGNAQLDSPGFTQTHGSQR
ncbi:MAG: PEGA domain-containing protein [Pirellulales bacterium]|nr:PEGA domain-containing protein [Pirellulales bacterium]